MNNIRFGDFTWLAELFSPSPQQQDHAALVAMHKRTSELYEASPFTNPDIMGQFHFETTQAVLKASEVPLTQGQIEDVFLAIKAFSDMEPTLFAPPPRLPDMSAMTIFDEHKLRNHLQRQLFQLADYEQQSTDWQQFVCVMILECFSALPQKTPVAGQGYLEISSPLIEMAQDSAHLIEQLFIYLECDSARESKLFQDIAERLFQNMLSANRITMQDYQANPRLMRLSVEDFMKPRFNSQTQHSVG